MNRLRRILQVLGGGAASLLVAAFLVGYAAPYLSPTHFWWTDLFAVALPITSVGIWGLAVGLCAWGYWRRRWGAVAVGSLLLVLLVVRFGPRLVAWGPAPSASTSLRVMTFNVPPVLPSGNPPTAPLVDLIRREAPDVLALQEARMRGQEGNPPLSDRAAPSVQALLERSTGYSLPRTFPRDMWIQQPVMGRLALDSMTLHNLPPGGKRDARSRYTRTTFTWQGRSAVLYNLHLHTVGRARPWTLLPEKWMSLARWKEFFTTYREGALRRAQQARLIRRRIEREQRPVLVVGDFNSTPHQWAYRHLARGFQSAVSQRVRGWGGTFPAWYPLVQIDHILADPAWQVTTAYIPTLGTPAVSDHRPVVVHLEWKKSSS